MTPTNHRVHSITRCWVTQAADAGSLKQLGHSSTRCWVTQADAGLLKQPMLGHSSSLLSELDAHSPSKLFEGAGLATIFKTAFHFLPWAA